MAPAALQLDSKQFWTRLSKIYSFWRKLFFIYLFTWLFGYEIPDMLLIVSKKCLVFFGSASSVGNVVEGASTICRRLHRLILRIPLQNASVGSFVKEHPSGEFADAWNEVFSKYNFNIVDVTVPFGLLMAVKDQSEVALIKTACESTCAFFNKFLKPQLIGLVEEERVVSHAFISDACSKASRSSKYLADVDLTKLDLCYPPIIQSGGRYALKYSVISDDHNLNYGAIVCSLGLRYMQYCSNISRTLLVDPSSELQDIYALLCNVQQKVIEALKPSKHSVYNYAVYCLSLYANFFLGMVFNVGVGFAGVDNVAGTESIGKTISLFIADTVLVGKLNGLGEKTIQKHKHVYGKLFLPSIFAYLKLALFKEEEEEEPEQNKENIDDAVGRGKRSVVLQEQLRSKESKDEQRKQHQKELIEQLNIKARERLAQAKNAKSKQKKSVVCSFTLVRMRAEVNVLMFDLTTCLDEKHEAIIMPIAGSSVPVALFKKTEYQRVGISGSRRHIHELFGRTFRSTNVKEPGELNPPSLNLITASKLIKEMQKSFRAKEAEEREKEGVVQQDTLIVNVNKAYPRLKDLYVRPNMINKRLIGTLEAHTNGFRYVASRGDRLDILYKNIKHAFFQPCDGEMIVLIHFHLKDAILYGKRKHTDVQFFTEVGEITTDLGKRGGRDDRDDLYAEQAERDLRRKLNIAFKTFCDRIEVLTNQLVEFDTPFRSLGFYGVPYRSSVLLQPTSCCLVNLSDWPPLVITLDEVELVHFERVQFHLKNFDMVFIFKDYTQKPFSITAIPTDVLDHVKDWLNSCDIPYSEGIQSLNWPKIMKSILEDAEGFFDSGGWDFLTKDEGSDEEAEAEGSSGDDEDFNVDEEEESSEEDSDEDYESVMSSESGTRLFLWAESGKSWSELEEETRQGKPLAD
ncbi:FACT complex subunit spt16 [Trichuris trichiura]|uniref:FACT complex subunit n=1 Tax=Trichuris trichiura TaxID=36087 RepID=A0A077Z9T1_TRITR|nr:FACT complex subunit spt16 [Trichuris trichiura]